MDNFDDILIEDDRKEYAIPRRISTKFLFGFSMMDMVLLVISFAIFNSVIAGLVGNLFTAANKIIFINYGPTFFLAMLLREDPKTGESGMSFLVDFFIYLIRPRQYIYKGEKE